MGRILDRVYIDNGVVHYNMQLKPGSHSGCVVGNLT